MESLLFITTLMRLMDSAGLPDGGPRPVDSCFKLKELALPGVQFRPTLYTPLWDDDEEGVDASEVWYVLPGLPEFTAQFFLKEEDDSEA